MHHYYFYYYKHYPLRYIYIKKFRRCHHIIIITVSKKVQHVICVSTTKINASLFIVQFFFLSSSFITKLKCVATYSIRDAIILCYVLKKNSMFHCSDGLNDFVHVHGLEVNNRYTIYKRKKAHLLLLNQIHAIMVRMYGF